ncbi:hypothetical protein MBM09_11990 [Flaviramulus sp. BrNp1-15]|uniref:hypothetical protein n=1 Tax=Flaviramulus sp. BrNp1-15 TaxID=2916754 RepID=UPI001EE8B1A9|nr:hypothetical protein [Flaviramulus sp. BrNp1-15]ULC58639.1 hypothetical protein MBM09_11990 [Flaviramulus sp. BrNp1-15]
MKILTIFTLFLFINSGIIENNCVDNVKIGMDISEFLESKREIYKVKEETINLEGDDYPIFNVYENSELIYAVEPDENGEKVWRIWLYGQKFKTELGIGIGNTLVDLKNKYTIDDISTAEGSLFILVKEIEVGFELDGSKIPREWWNEMKLEELKNDLPISLIII